MGDFNQYFWVQENKFLVNGPILEVGSKFYNPKTSMNYRKLFPELTYKGLDVAEGDNVDFVADITQAFEKLERELEPKRFNTIICNSVLEHVDNIFAAAENISRLLHEQGVLFISVPFVWEEHGYPNDYWRFTPNGVKYLFPKITFLEEKTTVSSDVDGDMCKATVGINDFTLRENIFQHRASESNSFFRKLSRMKEIIINPEFRLEYLNRNFFKRKNLLKKTCVNMVGIKR